MKTETKEMFKEFAGAFWNGVKRTPKEYFMPLVYVYRFIRKLWKKA